jgi:O-antigen biosynthesis protein WbqV
LGRDELPIELDAARLALAGKRVLVTGAGGSVGKHLTSQLVDLGASELVLLDHHDHALFALRQSIASAAPDTRWRVVLADVRDAHRMERIVADARPDVVFHLAAYKHVPFGEEFPGEAFAVNVLGTRTLLDLCTANGTEVFVYPSSDKAVNPPSMYGATKRISEALVRRQAIASGRAYVVARYVNILGTHGSVVESFAAQLREGRPLTITDPNMTRYWIGMREATWLLLQAAALGEPAGVLMLDAREEVPVVDLAQRLAAALAPGGPDAETVITGTRPGERLREELTSAWELFEPGPCPGILTVAADRPHDQGAIVAHEYATLVDLFERDDAAGLKRAAMALARRLQ